MNFYLFILFLLLSIWQLNAEPYEYLERENTVHSLVKRSTKWSCLFVEIWWHLLMTLMFARVASKRVKFKVFTEDSEFWPKTQNQKMLWQHFTRNPFKLHYRNFFVLKLTKNCNRMTSYLFIGTYLKTNRQQRLQNSRNRFSFSCNVSWRLYLLCLKKFSCPLKFLWNSALVILTVVMLLVLRIFRVTFVFLRK